MAFTLEVDLDSVTGTQDESFITGFEGFFQKADFIKLGLNPIKPTDAKPGSVDKVLMLAARYAAGLPLWHDSDCYDHGPGGEMGFEEE